MCGSGSLRKTTSGGISISGKVDSLLICNRGFVFALSSSRVNMPGNRGMLWLAAVAATPAMVFQVRCTVARFGACWRVGISRAYAGAVGKAGAGAGGNVFAPFFLVPVVPDWRACVSARLSGAACLVLCWVSRRSLSAWTCKREKEDARVLMLSSIWSI